MSDELPDQSAVEKARAVWNAGRTEYVPPRDPVMSFTVTPCEDLTRDYFLNMILTEEMGREHKAQLRMSIKNLIDLSETVSTFLNNCSREQL